MIRPEKLPPRKPPALTHHCFELDSIKNEYAALACNHETLNSRIGCMPWTGQHLEVKMVAKPQMW
jgi:hypothetical protein